MADTHPAPERNLEEQITVRQVTNVHANWSEQERGAPGKFSFQLILDDGAEEYAIRPPAEDSDVLMDLFKKSKTIYFDMGRQVLIFGNISLG
ncbi:MAG TPA: hypothetical protein VFH32_02640 [Rubrobacteraceae bacterium]|nr:hypothetical protein [Rubrobacteraceae bacterium]